MKGVYLPLKRETNKLFEIGDYNPFKRSFPRFARPMDECLVWKSGHRLIFDPAFVPQKILEDQLEL